MVIDSHVHTELSGHARGRAPEYARHAADNGIDILTFTEHMPIPAHLDPAGEYTLSLGTVPTYLADVAEAAGVHGVRVLCGAEIDWLPDHPEVMERNTRIAPFDVILGSVHFVDDWAFDDPALVDRYQEIDVDQLWREYFDRLAAAAGSGLFDVMAHPDLVKKFGFMPSYDLGDLYEGAANAFADAGVAIEVSSAGLHKPCNELYPSSAFLKACALAGVPATVSSDAHKPEHVGRGFDTAVAALRDAGYESLVYFIGRKPVEVSLTT